MTPSPSTNNSYNSCEVTEDIDNTKQVIIHITKDKLENALYKYGKFLTSRFKWIESFAILLALILTQTTANFKDSFGISKYTWEAFFLLFDLLAIFWFIFNIYISLNSITIDEFINKLSKPDKTNS